ncbi:MAG TPA: bifunctional DNA-formamidopyrimidine glycosylase/DNA-(apurinic or apyrimidinic site) lyase [Phycisphaerae bacterium]|nr:bifunctional DNA-formamidopyrimidine glycosylase/DNA-(apurinic or apyrimidinic site) lyase [Phycisphaerae bacterium]HRY66496.1 bifunctional DNA-formamidopyrimidine glycosylase/DNA-(apurinic or apyrimidinic site) lyase [Phycisphaerae bacterium]HSA30087.1 bifunctional DNA-formamidopyrimidine glycosylase/DNA-(apurinic or apyrimidinic site) lyase [Phycisphaerae bacterium]
MPELPEVETVARGVARHVTGCRIASVVLGRGDIVHGEGVPVCAFLRGRRIERVGRRGKQIHIELGGGRTLVVHLGMTGRLIAVDRDTPVETHTHLRIGFDRRRVEMRFIDPRRFGGLWLLVTPPTAANWIGRRLPPVGVDALTISFKEFRDAIARRRQIKALMLDQRPIGGIGNIYADESLHRAGVHPLTRADRLDTAGVRRLWRCVRRVLEQAVEAGGSSISDYRTADNEPGHFQVRHRVYQRAGRPCPKCRTPIEHLTAAGRSTFICPKCQPSGR